MPDAVIRADAVQAAPAGYKVPGAQEILVKSVRAVVDGSAAAASFDAVLQLIDPAGNVVWQAPTGTTIAAGGSADVSWFPGVTPTQTAAGGTGTPWAIQAGTGVGVTAAGGGGHAIFNASNTSFYTSDSAVYQKANNGGFGQPGIQILELGHYLIFGSFVITAFGAGAVNLSVTLADGPGFTSFTGEYALEAVLTSTPDYGTDTSHLNMSTILIGDATTGNGGLPNPIVWEFRNDGANAATAVMNGYHVMQLDTVDTSIP